MRTLITGYVHGARSAARLLSHPLRPRFDWRTANAAPRGVLALSRVAKLSARSIRELDRDQPGGDHRADVLRVARAAALRRRGRARGCALERSVDEGLATAQGETESFEALQRRLHAVARRGGRGRRRRGRQHGAAGGRVRQRAERRARARGVVLGRARRDGTRASR